MIRRYVVWDVLNRKYLTCVGSWTRDPLLAALYSYEDEAYSAALRAAAADDDNDCLIVERITVTNSVSKPTYVVYDSHNETYMTWGSTWTRHVDAEQVATFSSRHKAWKQIDAFDRQSNTLSVAVLLPTAALGSPAEGDGLPSLKKLVVLFATYVLFAVGIAAATAGVMRLIIGLISIGTGGGF